MRVATMDLRPGGRFHYCYVMPNGSEMWGIFVYREFVAPERLVFTNSFSDAEGTIVREPFSADWPLEAHEHVDLLSSKQARRPSPCACRAYPCHGGGRKTFEVAFASLQQGSKGTFDQLVEYLAKVER